MWTKSLLLSQLYIWKVLLLSYVTFTMYILFLCFLSCPAIANPNNNRIQMNPTHEPITKSDFFRKLSHCVEFGARKVKNFSDFLLLRLFWWIWFLLLFLWACSGKRGKRYGEREVKLSSFWVFRKWKAEIISGCWDFKQFCKHFHSQLL